MVSSYTTRLLSTAAVVCMVAASGAAYAGEASLDAKLDAMMERIEKLESENKSLKAKLDAPQPVVEHTPVVIPAPVAVAAPTKQAATSSDKKDGMSVTVPGTETTIKLGGYIKVDAINDIGTGYGADFANFAAIPLDGSALANKSGDFHMHARHTRLNLTSTTPTKIGDVKAFLEADFFGVRGNDLVTNGHGPQLRQAYGQVGGLLAGQTWSNFMDMQAYPESLDFIGPVGITLLRQVQVRYTGDLSDSLSYSVSAENPYADVTNGGTQTVTDYDRAPDLVAALTQKTSWGHWSARGLLRDISVQNDTTNDSEHDLGYAFALSSKVNLWGKDYVQLRGIYGDGLGRYVYDIAQSGKAAAYNNGELETQKALVGYANYQHRWNEDFRSNFMGGYAKLDNETSLIGTAQNETIWSAHSNLIWQPVKAYSVGLEYMHGYRELDSGKSGDLDRVMASFIYNL